MLIKRLDFIDGELIGCLEGKKGVEPGLIRARDLVRPVQATHIIGL